MLTNISPELKKIGEVCLDLAKRIESSQVEDGDPPFEIDHDNYLLLAHCQKTVTQILESTKMALADIPLEFHLEET